MHCDCGTNNRAPRWTFTDPCKPEVRPGAREESASPAWLAAPAMNARDKTKVYIWRLDTGCGPTLYRKCHSPQTHQEKGIITLEWHNKGIITLKRNMTAKKYLWSYTKFACSDRSKSWKDRCRAAYNRSKRVPLSENVHMLNRFIDRWNYWGIYKLWICIQNLLVFLDWGFTNLKILLADFLPCSSFELIIYQ